MRKWRQVAVDGFEVAEGRGDRGTMVGGPRAAEAGSGRRAASGWAGQARTGGSERPKGVDTIFGRLARRPAHWADDGKRGSSMPGDPIIS